MSDGETGKAPAEPLTRLALRCWQVDRVSLALRSVVMAPGGKQSWVAKQMANPEGNWPHDRPLTATCTVPPRKPKEDGEGTATARPGPLQRLHMRRLRDHRAWT